MSIIHTKTNTTFTFKIKYFSYNRFLSFRSEYNFKFSRLINKHILAFILISVGMSSNNNWFLPSRNQSWNVFTNDRFSKNCSIKNSSDCTIRRFPHLFKLKFFNSFLVRSNGCAFNSYLMFQNSISSINSNLIICFISVLNR